MASSTPLFSSLFILFLFSSSSSSHVFADAIFPTEALPTKSGYLPVSGAVVEGNSSSALFYAFYEAQEPLSALPDTPLLIWLQGGPGCSSMFGNFFELGPWLVSANSPTLRRNLASWNRRFGLLFIDNPVGTGFSVAASLDVIPQDETGVAEDLWFALQSFLSSNPTFRRRPLYITGESYAGKYVPAAAYYIMQKNPEVAMSQRVNLRGVAIGNGLTHPVAQVGTYADVAFFAGLVDEKQKAILNDLQQLALDITKGGNWVLANLKRQSILNALKGFTGLPTIKNLSKKRDYDTSMLGVLLNNDEVKIALGVPKAAVWEQCSDAVMHALYQDVMQSAKDMVEELLRMERKVLLYQGIYDLLVGVVSTEAWLKELQWEETESFLKADRKVWKLDGGELAGYVQRWRSLSHVVISGAGHFAPVDQPANTQAMIEDWVLERGMFTN